MSRAVEELRAKLLKKNKIPSVNLPALARRDVPFMKCWVADEGELFISCDFSSLEPSISAHFSADPYYRYATFDGIGKLPYIDDAGVLMIDDVYLMTASQMPGLSDTVIAFFQDSANCALWLTDRDAVTGHKVIKPLRSKAKPACLGFNYGMGPRKFVKQAYDAGMTVEFSQAKQMFKAYWALFAKVQELSKRLEMIIKKQGCVINPFGYRLTPEPHKGYNAFIQSSASGVVDLLIMLFFPKVPYARLVAIVHDEIIFTIPKEMVAECRKAKEEAVIELNELLGFSVPMRLSWTEAITFAEIK